MSSDKDIIAQNVSNGVGLDHSSEILQITCIDGMRPFILTVSNPSGVFPHSHLQAAALENKSNYQQSDKFQSRSTVTSDETGVNEHSVQGFPGASVSTGRTGQTGGGTNSVSGDGDGGRRGSSAPALIRALRQQSCPLAADPS